MGLVSYPDARPVGVRYPDTAHPLVATDTGKRRTNAKGTELALIIHWWEGAKWIRADRLTDRKECKG